VFFVPIGEKFVFFVPIGEKFVFFGREKNLCVLNFNVNVMISRFFPIFHPKRAGTGKPGKKRENGQTGNGDDPDMYAQECVRPSPKKNGNRKL
jgi:hypothetical protein